MSQVVGLDMVTGMGFIGLEPGRLYKIGQSPKLKDQTASGNPLLLNSAEAPLTALTLYGWSKQDGTPSPDNPVPIVSAGSVMVESKNLFNYKNLPFSMISGGVTIVANSDGSFTISGEGQLTNVFSAYYDDYDLVKKLKVGTISLSTLAFTKPHFYVQLKNDTGISVLHILSRDDATTSGEITEEILTQTKYVRYGFFAPVGNEIVPGTIFPMLYQDGDGTFEPYFTPYADPDQGEINVTVQGGNLFDTSIIPPLSSWDGESEGVFVKDENTLFVKIPSNNSVAKIIKTDGITAKRHELLPNVSVGDQIVFGHGTDDITNYFCYSFTIGVIRAGNVITVTEEFLNENANLYGAGVGSTVDRIELTINYGSTPLPYMPYKKPQTLTVQTPGGLPGVPVDESNLPDGVTATYVDLDGQAWMSDEIDYARKVYVQRIWTETFDGSNYQWTAYTNETYPGFYVGGLPEVTNKRNGFCNQFEVVTVSTPGLPSLWIGSGSSILYAVNNPFYDDTIEDKGLANWKAHLAAHPLVVMTYLTTPTETDLSAEEIAAYKALHTYSPATTVSNDADVQMGVGYKK